tara:strand:- start:453 stop:1214 length:762 start_codon:yes stop_codon:yes gene_type:complete
MSDYSIPNPDYPTELVDRLKSLMTDEIVHMIATADCGDDAHEHEVAIRRIVSEPRIPRPMLWEPRETLQLTRWWNPEEHNSNKISALSLSNAHVAAAFSCACLLACDDDGTQEPYNSLPQLIRSCYAIDPSLLVDIFPLINWYLRLYPTDAEYDINHEEIIASSIGKLVVSCMLGDEVEPIINILNRIQSSYEAMIGLEKQWVFSDVLGNCSARPEWIKLAKKWLLSPPLTWNQELREKVIYIGTRTMPPAWV